MAYLDVIVKVGFHFFFFFCAVLWAMEWSALFYDSVGTIEFKTS